MKCLTVDYVTGKAMSHPVRGAWVEISCFNGGYDYVKSHPVRGAWVEIVIQPAGGNASGGSHPVRGAWVEIQMCYTIDSGPTVAPREGCVG